MDNFERHIEEQLRNARHVQLSRAEREDMKRALRLYIADNPVRATRAAQWHVFAYRYVASAFVLVVCVGGGTSYAAQSALPGDALYPVKINLNEAVIGAFQTTAAEKAQWNTTLASRRLEEAETLVAEGRLTPIAQAQVEQQFTAHAENFDTEVASLKSSQENATVAAADAQSDLEATLNAHATILAQLSATSSWSSVGPILSAVRASASKISQDREATDQEISTQTNDTLKVAAAQKHDDARKRLPKNRSKQKEVQNTATVQTMAAVAPSARAAATFASSSLDATSTDESPDPVTQAFENGEVNLQEGNYGKAFTKFQSVIRGAVQVQVSDQLRTQLSRSGVSLPDFSGDQDSDGSDIHSDGSD